MNLYCIPVSIFGEVPMPVSNLFFKLYSCHNNNFFLLKYEFSLKHMHTHYRKSPLTLPFKVIVCSFYTFQIFFQFAICMLISFAGLFLRYRDF